MSDTMNEYKYLYHHEVSELRDKEVTLNASEGEEVGGYMQRNTTQASMRLFSGSTEHQKIMVKKKTFQILGEIVNLEFNIQPN